jgi:tricorn protease
MKPQALPAAYLRQPTLNGDTIAFVSDDDLWRVSTAGGTAMRLTTGLGEAATPQLSPCGRWLAFTGRDEQHAEVWLMPAAGGAPRRLTWLGAELAVRGFTPEGRIVFTSNHGQPFFRNWHAFTIGVEGGLPERVPLGAIDHLAFGPGGRRLIGRNTGDPARWKRYRGGRVGQLWLEEEGASEAAAPRFRRMTELGGNVTCPMWLGHRIYFVSDAEGVANLFSVTPDGRDLKRHTHHADWFVRSASCDGERIVYACGAEIWLFDPARNQPQRIEIDVPSARTQAARRFVPAAEHLQGVMLHPQGHSLALEVRGQAFTMPLWEGAVQRHGSAGPGAGRRRLVQWLADGQTLVCTSDASGEERLVLARAGERERELPWDLGRITALAAAPAGEHGAGVAIANHRNELWFGHTGTGALTRLEHSAFGRIEDPVFSPCGGWVAYTVPTSVRHTAIRLVRVSGGEPVPATQPEFRDYAPAFCPSGKYLYFLSLRTFDPVYDAVQFELSFPRAARPYLIALQADAPPPFEPQPKGLKPEHHDGPPPDRPAAAALPPIEPQGLARRVMAFPVPEGRYGRIAGTARRQAIWSALPIAGAHGRGGHPEQPGRIERFDFDSGEVKLLHAKADGFVLAADGHTLLVREGHTLHAIDATKPLDERGGPREVAGGGGKPSRDSGLVDLTRVRVAVDPAAEWAQMLDEVWRLQRDHFWVPDMAGIDWPALRERYRPMLARVATRGELSDLIWELQGELGTSHAYEMGGDHRKPPAVALGRLAAEFAPAPPGREGWLVTRTVQGDAWDAAADSPLNAIGVAVQPGECLVAIGGQPLSALTPPQALLVNQAGQKLALTLQREDGSTREVLVKALADETPARYREWVERNRAWVHEHSQGRVGYLHLPDMMSAGFAEFHRYFGTECERDALIVDVRYNRGGHVSQLLLEKVARKRIARVHSRWGQPQSYPEEAPAGPVVALTNEHAGSDGDIFSHCFKLMGVGPLVGQRTWGGVIGIWPRHKLIDGTETTQPEYAFWFTDVGFKVENFGTEPTVEVANAPEGDAAAGPDADRQLRTAMQQALSGA